MIYLVRVIDKIDNVEYYCICSQNELALFIEHIERARYSIAEAKGLKNFSNYREFCKEVKFEHGN